ncbi:MAG TPA: 3-hydroxyacyl-CoA dehydrogenase NAD-binding domain-containing protein, partial [Solirubrobacterales bacterium]|nr:3-hydroxyacyl-CoA dehydrogenase NAD-binding domain-containing protein [Solirubrobacterales bacterium]
MIGAGSMGAQIAQQAALHGVEVWLQDVSSESLERAVASNRGHLDRRVDKGRMSRDDAETALARVNTTTELDAAVAGADFVIEAVFEDLDVKRTTFAALDRTAPPSAVLASNSSTIGISKLAEATS